MQADRFTIKSQEAVQAAEHLAYGARNRRSPPGTTRKVLLKAGGREGGAPVRAARHSPEAIRGQLSAPLDGLPTLSGAGEAAAAPGPREGLRDAEGPPPSPTEYVSDRAPAVALNTPPRRRRALRTPPASATTPCWPPSRRCAVRIASPTRTLRTSTRRSEVRATVRLAGRNDRSSTRIIRRDDEIRRVEVYLTALRRTAPVLIGEPSVGKTAVEGLSPSASSPAACPARATGA